MRNTLIDQLIVLSEENKKINIVTADLGYSVLEEFASKYPNRFFNVGICEQAMASIAAGMALVGNTVFTYSIGNFPTLRCIEQIRNDICYHDADVKIVAVGGGLAYGALGMSHHATEDIAMLRILPNMKVFVPADPEEASAVVNYVTQTKGPCYIRLSKNKEPNLYNKHNFNIIQIQKINDTEGKIAILSCGPVLKNVLDAVKLLEIEGIYSNIYSVPCIKPFDQETFREVVNNHEMLISVEEHMVNGGLGSVIAEELSLIKNNNITLYRMGLNDTFSSVVGSYEYLCDYYGISAGRIKESICNLVKEK